MLKILLLVLMVPGICKAVDEPDMNALFSNKDFFVESESLEESGGISAIEDRSISFSGSFAGSARYTLKRDDYILKTIFVDYLSQIPPELLENFQDEINKIKKTYHIGEDDWFTSDITANLLFDIRVVENIKGFINLDAIYYPYGYTEYSIATDENFNSLNIEEEKNTDYVLKEIFLDANINKKIFFRFGKQVLQWGRGYFFNPTDLINIEKKPFLDMDANREGVYGLKAHIPFGVNYNIYSFLDLGSEDTPDAFAYAGKFEFLIDKTEMSFSAWKKKGVDPVFGFDVSTRLSKFDIIGELSLTSKETVLRPGDNFTVLATEDEWIPRFSVGIMRAFDFNDVDDRITIASEVYYNHAGYKENVFDDADKLLTLFAEDLYMLYNHSVYYAVLFTEFKKFIISDLSISLSGLTNFNDNSCIAMTQLIYSPMFDFTIECSIAGAIGGENTEYTFTGEQASIELVAKIFF